MQTVIRNGKYIFVEKLEFNDIEVPIRPHSDAQFINGEWILDLDNYFKNDDSKESQKFLNETDWQVIRHRDQLALGIETSLSDEEYLELLQNRQNARKRILTRAESSNASELVPASSMAECKNCETILEQSEIERTVNN